MGRIKRVYLDSEDPYNSDDEQHKQPSTITVLWTLQKIIDVLRRRFKDLDKELKVYENMTGEYIQLDTNELMKIINLSYLNEDQDEIDIDSNLNL
jgi:hypothetical protein